MCEIDSETLSPFEAISSDRVTKVGIDEVSFGCVSIRWLQRWPSESPIEARKFEPHAATRRWITLSFLSEVLQQESNKDTKGCFKRFCYPIRCGLACPSWPLPLLKFLNPSFLLQRTKHPQFAQPPSWDAFHDAVIAMG